MNMQDSPRTTSITSSKEKDDAHDVTANRHDSQFSANRIVGENQEIDADRLPSSQGPAWDGPENRKNWPLWKRAYVMMAPAVVCLAVTLGTSIITPTIPVIQQRFSVGRQAAIFSLSLFVYGLALGPCIAAPISETFGRMPLIKGSVIVYILFLVGSALAPTFGGMLACRFLAGVAGSPALAIGAGVGADLFRKRAYAIPCSMFIAAPFLGPALGPVIGGFVAYYKGYKWTQWVAIFAAALALLLMLPCPETYDKIILRKLAKKSGQDTDAMGPKLSTKQKLMMVLNVTIIRPVKMLFTEPIVLFLALYNSFTFSVLFSFFDAFPIVFVETYNFNVWQVGLAFVGIVVGVLLAVVTSALVDRYVYQPRLRQHEQQSQGDLAPEHRLYCAMMGSLGITIGLFWFAWTARRSIHWISPVLAAIPFAWGNTCLFISAVLYMIDVYGSLVGASATAANGLGRYLMAGSFPLFTSQMYQRLGIGWATSLLAFLSLVLVPIPWMLFKYGPRIRQRSSFIGVERSNSIS